MADKLKEFIQASRSEFDRHPVRDDFKEQLFRTMEQTKAANHGKKREVGFLTRFAAAASLLLIIGFGIWLWNQPFKTSDTPMIADLSTPPNAAESQVQAPAINQTSHSPDEKYTQFSNNNERSSRVEKSKVKRARLVSFKERKKVLLAEVENHPAPISIIEQTGTSGEQPKETTQEIAAHLPVVNAPTETTTQIQSPQNTNDHHASTSIATPDVASSTSSEPQSVGSFLKKGVMKFLSKKTKQWTNNAVDLKTTPSDEPSSLALNIKSELFEFSKSIPLNHENE